MRADIDRAGIASLHRLPAMYEIMVYHAGRAAAVARFHAPVGPTGQYRRLIFHQKLNTPYAAAAYGSTDYKAWWVEFGSVHNRAHHTLENAGRMVGLQIRKVAQPGMTRWGGAMR